MIRILRAYSPLSLEEFARISVFFYLLALPFTHNAAWKNIATVFMLLAVLWLVKARSLEIDLRSPIVIGLSALLVILTLSALTGVAPLESLNELRKHFLPAILLFMLTSVVFNDEIWQRRVFIIVGAAFLVRTGLALGELIHYEDLQVARADGMFVKGFALDAGFYLPVYLGLALWSHSQRWLTALAIGLVITTILMVQGRAPLLASLISMLAILFLLRRWRVLAIFLGLGLLLMLTIVLPKPEIRERFAPAFSLQTYLKALDPQEYGRGSDGLSGRTPIWLGVIEIANERPTLGHGFGWKKLGALAVEKGYVARWQEKKDDPIAQAQSDYFSLPTDKVNPHNLYLQIYFEAGILGLMAYSVLVLILIKLAWQQSRRGSEWGKIVTAITFGFLIDHLILGLANGLWLGLGPSMAWLGLFEATRRNTAR